MRGLIRPLLALGLVLGCAAAYAQEKRADEVARVVAAVHRLDPAFDPQEFGSKFLSPSDLGHLRDGLRKAGLLM